MTPSCVNRVTVETIDKAFVTIASRKIHLSTIINNSPVVPGFNLIEELGKLYRQLRSREAKWLTRLILKDIGAVTFPDELDCGPSLGSLPRCIQIKAKFQTSFPESKRRDGPGLLRLGAAMKAYENLPPTPPRTAPEQCSPTTTRETSCRPQSMAKNINRLTPLQERPEAVNHQSLTLRKSPQRLFPPQENPMNRLIHKTPKSKAAASTSLEERGIRILSPSRGTCTAARIETSISFEAIYGTGKCQLTVTRCPLTDCIFLLAPCVAKFTWVTENLLRWHGSQYILSVKEFFHPYPSRRCPRTGKACRMVILVEPRQTEQTVNFLRRVQRLKPNRPRAQTPPVDVYDWRILEFIAKVNHGNESAKKSCSKYRICEV